MLAPGPVSLWMTLKGRLPTRDRLVRFGIINETGCCLCGGDESIEHLFFTCRVTYKIWGDVLTWLNFSHVPMGWQRENDWLIKETSKKGWKRKALKIAITETIYEIWKG